MPFRLTLACLMLLSGAAYAVDLQIGYVNHYPMIKHQDDQLDDTGTKVLMVRAPWALVQPERDRYDFSMLDEQLQWADQEGLQLVFIMEAGPAHAAGARWMIDELTELDETQWDRADAPRPDPSIFSERYKAYLADYLATVTRYLAEHELADHVLGYSNGCEWWYLTNGCYNPLDIAAFRAYLLDEYGDIGGLNQSWGTSYGDATKIDMPRVDWDALSWAPQAVLLPEAAIFDACYATQGDSHIAVMAGDRVRFEVDYSASGVSAGTVSAEIAWLGTEKPQPIKIDRDVDGITREAEGMLVCEAVAPEGATQAWLLMKTSCLGRVEFSGVRLFDAKGAQVAPNPTLDPAAGGWVHITWTPDTAQTETYGWDEPGSAWIAYAPKVDLPGAPEYPLAEIYDWQRFRDTAHAEFIDWMAARIKEVDPERPVVSYLTIGFANAFEWDLTEYAAMRLDDIARIATHIDILGAQLASGEGDYDSITGGLDIMRKYGKPMWAVDLLDFTRGVGLGEDGLTRLSASVVQHGGSGIQYYCWYGTPLYNYTDLGLEALERMTASTVGIATAVGESVPAATVALIAPKMALYAFAPEPLNDFRDFMGWYKLLVRAGVCPDVYMLEELPEADLTGYDAIVAPDCAYGPLEAVEAFRRAVDSGVALITSGRQFRRDMHGHALDVSLPVEALSFAEPVGAQWLGEAYRCPTCSDTPPRVVCREGEPDWSHPRVAEALAALADAGVTLPLVPSRQSATAIPLTDGRLFVVPTTDGGATVSIGGEMIEVPASGALVGN